jgi:DUF1680 family protein
MNLAYADASYADLYEETLYNAILGSVDLEAQNFTYTNPLVDEGPRYPWHEVPCCVGNIPRTLLNLPEWMYARSPDGIDVNLYLGSTVDISAVVGTKVELIQKTDYPWKGAVSLTVNPAVPSKFTIRLRIPNHNTSRLYQSTPEIAGYSRLILNGQEISPKIEKGYVAITRQWKAGDQIDLELPMGVQRVKANEKVKADRGQVALRFGPIIYAMEGSDADMGGVLASDAVLTPKWEPSLLGGVVTIQGHFANGAPFAAIPYYARQNRPLPHFRVWLKDQ